MIDHETGNNIINTLSKISSKTSQELVISTWNYLWSVKQSNQSLHWLHLLEALHYGRPALSLLEWLKHILRVSKSRVNYGTFKLKLHFFFLILVAGRWGIWYIYECFCLNLFENSLEFYLLVPQGCPLQDQRLIVCYALSSMWYLKVFKPLLEHIVHTINTSLMVFKT